MPVVTVSGRSSIYDQSYESGRDYGEEIVSWYGHMIRMNEERLAKGVMGGNVGGG